MVNLYIFNETSQAAVYGIGTYIRELTTALNDSDINVCIVHLRSEKPDEEPEETVGIHYWRFPPPINPPASSDWNTQNDLYYRNIVYLLRLQIKNTDNLVFQLNYNKSGKLAEELRKSFDCRIVSVVHYLAWGLSVYDNQQRLRSIVNKEPPDGFAKNLKKSFQEEKSLYAKLDHVICLSNYMHEILCRDYELDAAKISVIPNGLKDTANTMSKNKLLRKKWKIPDREKILLFAGRIDEAKGMGYLIKAYREVLEKYPNSRLIIAGNGNYDTYMQKANDICTKITFTGLLEKTKLHEWYQMADIGVLPSLFETFGYVAVEMMMHGLPVVATATSGLNEVVDDTCGLKVPIIEQSDSVEIDTDLLAEKIMYLLQHPDKARKMGENGRKRYVSMYTSEIFGQNMLNFYHSLFKICKTG